MMNNDLISRSDIKDHISELLLVYSGEELANAILNAIDNASASEIVFESNERSQGAWIDHSEDEGYVECPICGYLTTCEGNIDELHYCWNCGAKLRKGGAE